MDIFCPRCGEPVDVNALYDIANAFDITYAQVAKAFRKNGCSALDYGPKHPPTCDVVENKRTLLAAAAMELSDEPGDWAADLDGWV